MSFFTSPAFGQMAGAAIGGLFGGGAAKRQGAMDRYAVDQMMRPFNLKEAFLRDLYSGSLGALNDALATGAFTGPTCAGFDPLQRDGIAGLGSFGRSAMGFGTDFMNRGTGFAQNAQGIFNRTQGRTLDDAVNYATNSPQADAMVDAA